MGASLIYLHDPVFKFPGMIEAVPGQSAREMTRRPDLTAARTLFRIITQRRPGESVQGRLAQQAKFIGRVFRILQFEFPGQPRQIAGIRKPRSRA